MHNVVRSQVLQLLTRVTPTRRPPSGSGLVEAASHAARTPAARNKVAAQMQQIVNGHFGLNACEASGTPTGTFVKLVERIHQEWRPLTELRTELAKAAWCLPSVTTQDQRAITVDALRRTCDVAIAHWERQLDASVKSRDQTLGMLACNILGPDHKVTAAVQPDASVRVGGSASGVPADALEWNALVAAAHAKAAATEHSAVQAEEYLTPEQAVVWHKAHHAYVTFDDEAAPPLVAPTPEAAHAHASRVVDAPRIPGDQPFGDPSLEKLIQRRRKQMVVFHAFARQSMGAAKRSHPDTNRTALIPGRESLKSESQTFPTR